MIARRGWRLAWAGCLVFLFLGCNDPARSTGAGGIGGGAGGVGGLGGAGADCTTEAINACLDLQNCCRAILVNPVFFQSCNSVVLQCDEQRCREVLAGYATYEPCRPEPEPDAGVGGAGGSAEP